MTNRSASCLGPEANPLAVEITFNGEPRRLSDGSTVATLLASLGMTARHVAVELNLEVVPRRLHAETTLAPGDRVEVVSLVGGG